MTASGQIPMTANTMLHAQRKARLSRTGTVTAVGGWYKVAPQQDPR